MQLSLFEDAKPLTLVEKVRAAVDEIKELYLDRTTPGPWAVACSFGKDSTTVLSLVCRAIQEIPVDGRWREVYVVTSDTKIENPEMEFYAHNQSRLVNEWAKENAIPITSRIVSRELKRSFWVVHLGKGYPLPGNGRDRTCTHQLKIEPQNNFLQELKPALLLLGSRDDESSRRARTIAKYEDEKASRFGESPYQKGIKFYTPIRTVTTEEIWEFLQAPLPWGSSIEIRRLYREATGECGLINPAGATKARNACGARFGCWVCPPLQRDKSTENMALIHEWLHPLTEFRKELKEAWDGKKNPQNRSGFMRNQKLLKPGQGCITIPTRKHLFQRLMEVQEEVNDIREQDGLDPLVLIDDEEIETIQAQWVEDEQDRPWLMAAMPVDPAV
ncbi:phosphoadenosine phosphosulfate reductase family protein [Tumebacillus permanentifrigoris]|uniref:DNA sulfur modification protein DndC n=1 Tax=Tumebacillus permanentifrigoris TaxID=378543 RepID=A0A316D2H3_9BACL|nr:phosphoadenosine phosphosulfate reductase family protein [Tumebacillus permanentifrigoris]PWK05070.1 DNA sulfur modification protein DndC [Tumebacillus permanentifrigoris]